MRAFDYALPDAWTCDVPAQGHDYGVDATVELFDDGDGDHLGLGFFVQVKATTKEGAQALSKSIKASTWRHYLRLDRPVLLVRYLKREKALYVRWAHRAVDRYPDEGQRTVTARWRPDDLWGPETPDRLVADVERFRDARAAALVRPVKVHVTFHPGEHVSDHFTRAVRRGLRDVIVQFGGLVELSLGALKPPGILVEVDISERGVEVDFGGITGARSDLPGRLDEPETVQALAATVFGLVAISADRVGHSPFAGQLLKVALPTASIRYAYSFAGEAVRALALAGHRESILLYFGDLIDAAREHPEVLPALMTAMTVLRVAGPGGLARNEVDRILGAHVGLIALREGRAALGAAYYTLANHLRMGLQERDRNQRALAFFNHARKLDPEYNERAYFAAEVAGALFELHRPLASAMWYERAVALGDGDPFTLARWGDALLYAGRFAEAAEVLIPYVSDPDALEARAYWWIRCRFAVHLRDVFGPSVRRSSFEAVALADLPAGCLPADRLAASHERLGLDPLNAISWFNAGIDLDRLGHTFEAARAFAFAASTVRSDTEAWANAFVGFMASGEEPEAQVWIAATGYAGFDSAGERFAAAVEGIVEAQEDPSRHSAVTEVLDALRATTRPHRQVHPMTLRANGAAITGP